MTGTPPQEWMTLAEAAEHARFTVTAPKHPALAFRRWARSVGLRIYPRGRAELVERRMLEGYLKRLQDARSRGPRRIA